MILITANCELLQQGIDLLARHDERTFNRVDSASYGSAIGSHFRHVLDHYTSFLAGVDTGLIDYDARVRDTALERVPGLARDATEGVKLKLRELQVNVEQDVNVRVSASTQGEDGNSRSSFGRELQFLVSHTVHHYALIAIASRMQGIYPSESFGVAPSTLKYLNAVGG